jgi:hypothetical protein
MHRRVRNNKTYYYVQYTQGRLQRRTGGAPRCCTEVWCCGSQIEAVKLHFASFGPYTDVWWGLSPRCITVSRSVAPWPLSEGSQRANRVSTRILGAPFRPRPLRAPSRVGGPSVSRVVRRWTLSTSLGTLAQSHAIILHHAPRPRTAPSPDIPCCLLTRAPSTC